MSNTQRLSHIQGLRGIAILLVVLFHLLPQTCPSGYMGVDVFFVISGYFLIGRQLEEGAGFQLFDFLKKKSLRLLIPYFAVVVLVAAVAVGLFPANELMQGNKLLESCLWAGGNVHLDHLSGNYFSTDTRTLPLMHLWYMGVLLQCYLLFTVLFAVWHFTRCGRKSRIIQIAVLGLLSLGVAYLRFTPIPWEYAHDTYYWASARVWEFSLGGLFYILPKPESRKAAVTVGAIAFLALVGCAWIPAKESAWMVLLGAACGCLLLRSGAIWEKLSPLNNPVLVWIGGISFSLYLVHWPCICFAEYVMGHPFTLAAALPAIVVILVLALLFYKWVEKPLYPLWMLPVLIAAAFTMQKSIRLTHGFREQLHLEANQAFSKNFYAELFLTPITDESQLYAGAEGIMPNNFSPQPNPGAVLLKDIGDTRKQMSFVVMGDSFALDFANGMHIAAQQMGWHGVYLNSYVTPYWNANYRTPPDIVALGNFFNEDKATRIMRWLKNHPELHTVFIVQFWEARLLAHDLWDGTPVTQNLMQARVQELREFTIRLKEIGKNVVLVTANPGITANTPERTLAAYLMWHKGEELPAELSCDRETYDRANAPFNHEMDKMAEEGLCHVLHREQSYFEKGIFHSYDGKLMSHRDSKHLTADGAFRGISKLLNQIGAFLGEKAEE